MAQCVVIVQFDLPKRTAEQAKAAVDVAGEGVEEGIDDPGVTHGAVLPA